MIERFSIDILVGSVSDTHVTLVGSVCVMWQSVSPQNWTILKLIQNILAASMLMHTLAVVLQPLRGLCGCAHPLEERHVMSIHAMFLQIPLLKLGGSQFLHIMPSA